MRTTSASKRRSLRNTLASFSILCGLASAMHTGCGEDPATPAPNPGRSKDASARTDDVPSLESDSGTPLSRPDAAASEPDAGVVGAADAGETVVASPDDSKIVSSRLPTAMTCGVEVPVSVTVRNAGSATWTRSAGYKLGAVDDEDPFYTADTRVWLPAGVTVAPGEAYTFQFGLKGPVLEGSYQTDWRMVHEGVRWFGETTSGSVRVTCPKAQRTPDPAPGQKLPLPNVSGVVRDVANQNPQLLKDSCQGSGGSWAFLDLVVDTLRKSDTRWGYNCKRGNCNTPSHDVIDYHFGRGPDEGSPDVYVIDMIVGHCGPDPRPGWLDVTGNGGAGANWTGRGRF